MKFMIVVNANKLNMLINVLENVHYSFQRFGKSTIHFHKNRILKFSATYV